MTTALRPLEPGLLTLSGVPASPYTRKMLAALRYRRIAYRLILRSHDGGELPRPKVPMLPTFYLPDPSGEAEAVTDSTPLIRRFDQTFPDRQIRPADPVLALIDAILEDYGDEWLTKAMFHYRWSYGPDIAKAAAILPTSSRGPFDDLDHARFSREISERQIPRLAYVGSNPTTAPVIEASYLRFLDIFEEHLRHHRFLLGARPSAGDFAVYGQLTQLAQFDPTPAALTLKRAPRVHGWVATTEDLSGLEPTEDDPFDPLALPDTVTALLAEVARVYVPLLLANQAAVASGAEELSTEIDGRPWRQRPFPYQAKCLSWLRRDYGALSGSDRARADLALAGTGCEALFTEVP